MIISCADSRVDPCKILGLDMGDAFVVRNIANLVPNYSEVEKVSLQSIYFIKLSIFCYLKVLETHNIVSFNQITIM